MHVLYIPCGNEAEAKKIATTLLSEKLIACANIIPSTSLYLWEGTLKEEQETILLVKTKQAKQAEERILSLHSYDVPCVLIFPVEANDSFARWVHEH